MQKIKNIAIVAHVDHGKTTLIDAILRQAGVFRANEQVSERVMDSNDIERERGITIFSKSASLHYHSHKINLVDTPGHADFGGEVQRIMDMVDSVLLLVDAFEGPMPQTKYVLKNALALGLHPIVVINKIDRPKARPHAVLDMVFELFMELGATNEQLDFAVIYASGKDGYAVNELTDEPKDIFPLLDLIIKEVPDTSGDRHQPLQMLVSAIEYDNYVGKMGTGKIHNGSIKSGSEVALLKSDGSKEIYRVAALYCYEGLRKKEIKIAHAGDIVAIAGLESIGIGETVADKDKSVALPGISIDEPTIAIEFYVNNSPFMGRSGKWLTSGKIWERLQRELRTNVSLVAERSPNGESFTVKGRGELQLSILMENMRREGYEFNISKPRVLYKRENGKVLEPIELATVDVSKEYVGATIEIMGKRKGEVMHMSPEVDGYTRLEFKVPARGLIGFRNEFLTETRGTGLISQCFFGYEEYKGEIVGSSHGSLIAMESGVALGYSLNAFQPRGVLFIGANTEVYGGMIVGQHSKDSDLVINVCKGKKLTNNRAAGKDDAIKLIPPRIFSLEQAMEYIGDDELLEITPDSIRMRKKTLHHTDRKRQEIAG
ncbi:MAG: translational GTPase TypA [Candidatus Cloacimonetes bacterium]|jgi:GTP-binding protein|nr:translational GTPase TypA [Candidatus Cloacimonadota bacterium]MDY0299867.1 translational GTPase TypA [Candidatus Cloacimonadaceae bacterium]MCB5279753.1 translational GTPase TypA [Candidatus Cloacimonadota bacterium]MCK9333226.1 translational GTPase TypA [Candidatus Cloacimonadota bacterium]MDD2210261.1 translational GTPase TypA [Candidatus Cloacimonadota bacterium]